MSQPSSLKTFTVTKEEEGGQAYTYSGVRPLDRNGEVMSWIDVGFAISVGAWLFGLMLGLAMLLPWALLMASFRY